MEILLSALIVILLLQIGGFIWLVKRPDAIEEPLDEAYISEIIDEAERIGRIKYKFSLAEDVSNQQASLLNDIDAPSMGSTHSKWKASLTEEISHLETQKIQIFKTILADGVDPLLRSFASDGTIEEFRMSELLARSEASTEAQNPSKSKTDKKINKQKSNVIKLYNVNKVSNNDTSPEKTD